MTIELHNSDCLDVLSFMPDNSVDALITDPPAGISFMGKSWDDDKGGRKQWIAWMTKIMVECLRVMKPGAHGLVWAIPRTSHWTATALEDAGFEVRDVVTHLFGSGFPKSMNISIAIDKQAGAIGSRGKGFNAAGQNIGLNQNKELRSDHPDYIPPSYVTDAAKQWEGWGTALKPASEFWFLIRKPLSEKTVAANVLKWGVGGLNIDGCRVGTEDMSGQWDRTWNENGGEMGKRYSQASWTPGKQVPPGRFPANLVLSHNPDCEDDQCSLGCAAGMLDAQSGLSKSTKLNCVQSARDPQSKGRERERVDEGYSDRGGASRFFYCAKTSTSERNAGLDRIEIVNVSLGSWENADLKAVLQVDTASLPPKVIDASGTLSKDAPEWNTLLFGSEPMDRSQQECKSTTAMAPSWITDSKTLSWLHRCSTSVSILDARSSMESGGNHVGHAQSESPSPSSTSAGMDTATNARDAILLGQLQIRSAGALKSTHPTVKPQKLMRYLCRLITPPSGVVLDPFMGSGSTGLAALSEGFSFIGIDKEIEYFDIAKKRIEHCELEVNARGN